MLCTHCRPVPYQIRRAHARETGLGLAELNFTSVSARPRGGLLNFQAKTPAYIYLAIPGDTEAENRRLSVYPA